MEIKNAGRGIHQREIVGIDKLKALPSDWYAYTNLELALSPGETRENDVFAVIDDRILLIDLKDWNGKVEGDQGGWFHNNRSMPSPVEKVRANARKIAEVLKRYLREQAKKNSNVAVRISSPFVQGCVVVTGNADLNGIAGNDRPSVFFIDDFVAKVTSRISRYAILGAPKWSTTQPLTDVNGYWRTVLGDFFNVQSGPFRPRQRLYGSYRALSDTAIYDHRGDSPDGGVYHEYDVEEDAPGRAPGLLRVWDFTRAATRFQTEEARHEIAGREREVIAYLKERNSEFDIALLQPKNADDQKGVNYWEVFEKRRQLQRLRDLNVTSDSTLTNSVRLDLARGLLERIKVLHDLEAAHLDIGPHSVWLELPSSVKVSHLFAASFPNARSLGEHRYQFLTAGWKFPEDSLGNARDHKRRDVFLLGATIHYILFGLAPTSSNSESPPTWNPAVDSDSRFASLYAWFARALAWDIGVRFADGAEALNAFNAALHRDSSSAKAFVRLERLRRWRDQIELTLELPALETLKRTERSVVYKSTFQDRPVIVKLWRRVCWDDDQLEAPRILDFLKNAERLSKAPPAGTAPIVACGFLGDAIVLVREFANGLTLDVDRRENAADWRAPRRALSFIEELANIIANQHESRIAHGDLKPENIIVVRTAPDEIRLVLIDNLEFSLPRDGEVMTSAYSPASGGSRFERDRYAVVKIAEEIIAKAALESDPLMRLAAALEVCRTGPPANATLVPLLDALRFELNPPVEQTTVLAVSLGRHGSGPMRADEGRYAVRLARNGSIIVRGASEELEMTVVDGRFTGGRRREISQGHIGRVARFETYSFSGQIDVQTDDLADLSAFEFIIGEMNLSASGTDAIVDAREEEGPEALDDDKTEDDLVESTVLDDNGARDVDVPQLWRSLIDAEQELYTEGVASGESVYRDARKRHLVPFDLERGAFDFARHDKVVVERPRQGGGGWLEVGLLDVDASFPNAVVIDATSRAGTFGTGGPLIREGDRLRFKSMLETYSRSRRETATRRILSRQSALPNLIDYFSPSRIAPSGVDSHVLEGQADSRYGLNADQQRAFAKLLGTGGVGLLQGPPGTGKTKFIASFVHHVLTTGMVSNVLLASQSHQAVNNAAEAVMELFRGQGDEPSFVRVGQEGAISSELRPFHSDRVEAQYKDRFRAEIRERLRLIGMRLNLESELIEMLTFAETSIRPVVERIKHLGIADEDLAQRISNLRVTVQNLCSKIGLLRTLDWNEESAYESLIEWIAAKYSASPDRVRRFLAVTKLSRDWLGSVSTRQRSFETFLAGTRSVVAGTCVGLGRSSLGLNQNRFDLVVIDEAARCTASELSVPMQSGSWILLVGDQSQLEPHHRPDVVEMVVRQTAISKREIKRSDFERMFYSAYGKSAGHTLLQQYRMLPPIGRVVSRSFYNGSLLHERTASVIPVDVLPPSFNTPLLWVATDSLGGGAFQQSVKESRSLKNEVEADAVIGILKTLDNHEPLREWLRTQREFPEPIGVICTYAAQRDFIRRRLPAAGLSAEFRENCKIDTVDSYQGKQNPIVILSLVRNNAEGSVVAGRANIRAGFMSQPNRINVALSRAMDLLVIVGAMHGWASGGPMATVVDAFAAEQGAGHARVVNAASLEGQAGRGIRARQRSRNVRKTGRSRS